MLLYNTLTKQKEEFKPLHPGKVGMYVCGPTVYDYIHIGNIRAYLNADTLRRYLEYIGYEVRLIKNITDVGHLTGDDINQGDSGEDKLAKKSLAEKKSPEKIAEFYEKYFKETEREMNILPASYFPKATAHIEQMIKIISGLIDKGYAYEKNGNVFFDIEKFSQYGRLSGNTLENLKTGARLEEHPDKKNPWDFALWLKAPEKHLMRWESPWSVGYPGWHIECSAMSTEYLGETIDIHTGGEDNIFPHHEAEIAQTQCYTGKKFVNYWIHVRHLLVNGEKMSKSKKNFYILSDIKEKGFDAMTLRLLLLSSHYRSNLNFTWNGIGQAKANLQKISDFVLNLEIMAAQNLDIEISAKIPLDEFQKRFENAMDDDLNTPLALSVLYELINETNKITSAQRLPSKKAREILSLWEKMNSVFGLRLNGQAEIPEEILELAKKRQHSRQEKKFQEADTFRKNIEEKGYIVEDTGAGFNIKKK